MKGRTKQGIASNEAFLHLTAKSFIWFQFVSSSSMRGHEMSVSVFLFFFFFLFLLVHTPASMDKAPLLITGLRMDGWTKGGKKRWLIVHVTSRVRGGGDDVSEVTYDTVPRKK